MTIVEELRMDRESGARRLEAEYKAGLMTLARRFCSDEGDAEELVNRTFAAVVEHIDDYLEQSAFFGWMSQILVNIRAKDVRRKSNRNEVAAGDAIEGPDAADDGSVRIFRDVDAGLLREAVESLPPDMREAVVLHYFLDQPVAKIAKILVVPPGTVKSRLHYARLALAAKLGEAAKKPGARIVLLALLLLAGLAAARGVAGWIAAHAEDESAESHAESAEFAESVFHAENAEAVPYAESGGGSGEAEPPPVALETYDPSDPDSPPLTSNLSPSTTPAMKSSAILAASASLALAAAPGVADDHWVYTPPASGTKGTISWTDSSGFQNVMNGALLSGGLITFATGSNTGNADLKNLDLSVPVYAADGTTQYAFSPMALGDASLGGRIVSGAYLTNVVLHADCKSVGRYAFKGCTALVKVTLNDGLEVIHEDAFRDDKALETIDNFFPDSLKRIGVRAFDSCNALAGTAVANGLERMDNRAFIFCYALEGFDCGESTLAKLEASTFYKDAALGCVVLPNTVTNIDSGVFFECTSLTNFTPLLPPALRELGTSSNNDRPFYDTGIRGHVVSPSTLTNLLSNSFRGTHIESFTSPKKGLKRIGQYAFSRCTSLTNIVLSADLEALTTEWVYGMAAGGDAHIWFRNLPANLPANLWASTTKQTITIHLPWSQQEAWREWVASGPSGHTFTFNKATKTLPDTLDATGTWQSSVTQNVTWWKDSERPTLLLIY